MLRFLISFRVIGENDFLYPTEFKQHFQHLGSTLKVSDQFLQPDDLDDDLERPTYPLLGYLLTLLKCRSELLPSSAINVLYETKKEICHIIELMFDIATDTRIFELLHIVQSQISEYPLGLFFSYECSSQNKQH